MGFLTASRRRRFFAIAATPLVIATAAFGYWLVTQIIGEGEGSNKVAKSTQTTETIPLAVSFPELKGIGQPVQLSISVNEGQIKSPMEVDRVAVSFTNSRESEGCENGWFTLSHLNTTPLVYNGEQVGTEAQLFGAGLAHPFVIKPGEQGGEYLFSGDGAEVELKNEPGALQEACEGTVLHVHARTEP
jgi:hypothetical protein